jgi:hypothetical protein
MIWYNTYTVLISPHFHSTPLCNVLLYTAVAAVATVAIERFMNNVNAAWNYCIDGSVACR